MSRSAESFPNIERVLSIMVLGLFNVFFWMGFEQAGGTMVITADHGNAEMMRDPETGEPHTAHTLNPVPFVVVNPPTQIGHLENGRLSDIAPTLLDILHLTKPAAMTGHSLLSSTAGLQAAD